VPGARPSSKNGLQPNAAVPAWITPALIAETRAVWQPYYNEDLTDEMAVALLIPVGVLYEVLFPGEADDEEAEAADDEETVHCAGAGQ
jgi:hypothetical protein